MFLDCSILAFNVIQSSVFICTLNPLNDIECYFERYSIYKPNIYEGLDKV